jgi:hypothetical protein
MQVPAAEPGFVGEVVCALAADVRSRAAMPAAPRIISRFITAS